jgi:hypothetical protein
LFSEVYILTIIGRRYYRIRKTIPKFTAKVHDYYYYCDGFLSGRGSFLYLVLRRRPPLTLLRRVRGL